MAGQQKSAQGKSYSTNVLMSALGISRGTLRYYEQLGLVSPRRDPESNYRTYSNADVFRVVECVMLKNAGYQVQHAKEVLVDEPVDAEAFAQDCLEQSELQLRRAQAAHERFAVLREVVAHPDAAPKLERAQEWLIYYDGCEGGYDRFMASRAQDCLLEGMPISSFAAVLDVDVTQDASVETRWGRSIPAKNRGLMPDLELVDEEPAHFLGCVCVSLPYCDDEGRIPGFDRTGEVRARIACFLRDHGLRQAGAVVAPCVLPVRGKVYTRLYVPVEPAGLRGRMELAKLG